MKKHNGSALIVALLVVALSVAALLLVQVHHRASIQRTQKMIDYLKAVTFAQGMETWAVGRIKSLKELSVPQQAKQSFPIRVGERLDDGNLISGELMDASALLNVNNLDNEQDKEQLVRLINATGKQGSNSKAIAEQIFTLVQYHRAISSTAPMTLIDELHVTNIPDLAPILQYMIALPESTTKININHATAPVLLSLSKNLSEAEVNKFIQLRDKNGGFDNIKQAATTLSEQHFRTFVRDIDVASNYFLLHTHVQRNEIQLDMLSLFFANDTGTTSSVDLLWHGFV